MNVDELRKRIIALRSEPIEADLLADLRKLSCVQSADSTWLHGYVEIRVVLSEWTWGAQEAPGVLIDTFARRHVHQFSVSHHFEPPPLRPP